MKKRNLIIANTYFQLITAINLVLNNFSNDITDLVITDCSVGMKNKATLIKKNKLFNKVIYYESKAINNGNKIKKYLLYLFDRNKIIGNEIQAKYDEILFNNLNVLTYSVIDELYSKNPNIICSIYDEGFSTYTIRRKSNIINDFLRKIMFKKSINKSIKKIYLYHPYLLCYKSNLQTIKINNLDKKNIQMKKILNNIFDYKKPNFDKKIIFFEESFFCDNKSIDDFQLIKDICKVVGKENIIIKLHPRNKIDRFSKLNIDVWKDNNIPWEIYQMNEDYNNKIFMSISSGSMLASKLYFNENIKTYFLFNCTKKMSDVVTKKFYDYLECIRKNLNFDNIYIPKTKAEFLNKMKEECIDDSN